MINTEALYYLSLEQLVVNSIVYAVVAIMWAHMFPPFQWFKNWAFKKFKNYEGYWIINCPKCVAFWTTLFTTWSPMLAFTASLTAYFLDYFIQKVEEE